MHGLTRCLFAAPRCSSWRLQSLAQNRGRVITISEVTIVVVAFKSDAAAVDVSRIQPN